jgi:shikimate kinase
MRPIVFVGPMGAGKTTLGKKLAKSMGLEFIDTDKKIESLHGSISKLFADKGEDHFRSLEESVLSDSLKDNRVIATGGGIVLSQSNRSSLKDAFVVFLDTTMDSVIGRVNTDKRPLLRDNPERWQAIYDQRLPLYKEVASITVFTGNRPIKDLLSEIQSKVEGHEL